MPDLSSPSLGRITVADGQITVQTLPGHGEDTPDNLVIGIWTENFTEHVLDVDVDNEDADVVLEDLANGTAYNLSIHAVKSGSTDSYMFKASGFYIPSDGTANSAPVASSVAFTGTATQGQTLTRTYTYSDADSDPEGATVTQWYRSDNTSALNRAAISGATASTYVLQAGDVGKYIQVAVTPKASTGVATGTKVYSSYSSVIASSGGAITGYFLQTDTATPPTESELEAGTEFVIPTDDGNFTTTIPNIGSKFIHMGEPSTQTAKTVMNDTLGDAAINGENAFGSITTQGAYRVYTSNYATAFDNPITWKVS